MSNTRVLMPFICVCVVGAKWVFFMLGCFLQLSQGAKHQRTKSNPDCLANEGSAEQRHPATPPGTPPPPYPSPDSARRFHMLGGDSFDGSFSFSVSRFWNFSERKLLWLFQNNDTFAQDRSGSQNSQARPSNSRSAQQAIISMEDDDISDLEIVRPYSGAGLFEQEFS